LLPPNQLFYYEEVLIIQEELENKCVSLSVRTAKITAIVLATICRAAYQQMQQARDAPGKMSFKQLAKGGALSEVDITNDNIKAFEPIARKYGIHYSLQKDASKDPPLWRVYFRAKEADSMTAAFKEFSDKVLSASKDRPSVCEAVRKNKETVRNTGKDVSKEVNKTANKDAILVKVKNKHRGGPEL